MRRQNDRMYIINALLLSYFLFLCYSFFFTNNQSTCQPVNSSTSQVVNSSFCYSVLFTSNQLTCQLVLLLLCPPFSSLSLANCASYLVSFDAGFIIDAWRLPLESSVVLMSTEIYNSLLPIFL